MGSDVVEVTLAWVGASAADADAERCVLETRHLRVGERFVVGEGGSAGECDVLVPSEVLGAVRADVVSYDAAGALVVPPGGRGVFLWVNGIPAPAQPTALVRGQVIDLVVGAFTLRARMVEAEALAEGFAPAVEASDYAGIALSALAHLSCMAAFALFLPALGGTEDEGISRDQILTMQHFLNASAETEKELTPSPDDAAATSPEDHGASGGGRAVGKAGAMGTPNAAQNAGHWSASGDNPRELQSLSREAKQALVKDFGMLGLLASMNGDPNAPTVPWGDVVRGADRDSHLGALFGADAAESWGIGGLALGGNDEGAGGHVEGLGANEFGDLSASLDARIGHHDPGGIGSGCGGKPCLLGGTHVVHAGFRLARDITTNGRLPKDVIQRIVRQNAGRYRACYESGLRTNPALEGRVEVKFMIDRQGQVSMAQDGASDLPNDAVRSCIVKSFYSLSFPAPADGTVTVVYPMALTPSS